MINGHKWFTSNGSMADFLIVMAVTNPDVHPYAGTSMIIVPTDTPGVNILRDIPTMEHPFEVTGGWGGHSEIIYEDVRVPYENMVGNDGDGFKLAQERLGPGRIHHCMRWLGQSRRGSTCSASGRCRATRTAPTWPRSRRSRTGWPTRWLEMTAARLMTLQRRVAHGIRWAHQCAVEIAMIKYYGATVLYNVIDRAIQVHGSLGFSCDLPLEHMYRAARAARIYDGPDEVHKVTVARMILGGLHGLLDALPSTSRPGVKQPRPSLPSCSTRSHRTSSPAARGRPRLGAGRSSFAT